MEPLDEILGRMQVGSSHYAQFKVGWVTAWNATWLGSSRSIGWAPPLDHLSPNPELARLIPGFRPIFASDDFLVQLRAAEAGIGAIFLGRARHRFSASSLVELDVDFGDLKRSLHLVCAKRALDIPRVRAVADLLARELEKASEPSSGHGCRRRPRRRRLEARPREAPSPPRLCGARRPRTLTDLLERWRLSRMRKSDRLRVDESRRGRVGPAYADEDTTGGFEHGGWHVEYHLDETLVVNTRSALRLSVRTRRGCAARLHAAAVPRLLHGGKNVGKSDLADLADLAVEVGLDRVCALEVLTTGVFARELGSPRWRGWRR